jgi:hypothetical protein
MQERARRRQAHEKTLIESFERERRQLCDGREAMDEALFWTEVEEMTPEERSARAHLRRLLNNPTGSEWDRNFIRDVGALSQALSPKQIRVIARIAQDPALHAAVAGKCNY